MTIEQARALQDAVKTQDQQRNRLLAAGSDAEKIDAARSYIASTDALYAIACDVQGWSR